MASGLLLDAGTIRNFAACDRLDLLRELCNDHAPGPHWVEAVRAEIVRTSVATVGPGRRHCRYILSSTHGAWLGEAIETSVREHAAVLAIRTALASVGDHHLEHLGEAQTIFVAQKAQAAFATDDGAAFAFAVQRLGAAPVLDTVELLRHAVATGYATAAEAAKLVATMRAEGRILRSRHPDPLPASALA